MRIEMPWESYLLKNQAFIAGNPRWGHTKKCKRVMDDIFWLVKEQGGFVWNGERIQVVITAYRPRLSIDAQNLVDAVSDAIELAIGVNDREYDVSAIGKLDKVNPRIVIELSQDN